MKKIILSFFIIFLYTEDVFSSNDILSTDEAVEQLLGSPDEAKIRIQKITDNLYLFFGLGGNIAVSIGDDGFRHGLSLSVNGEEKLSQYKIRHQNAHRDVDDSFCGRYSNAFRSTSDIHSFPAGDDGDPIAKEGALHQSVHQIFWSNGFQHLPHDILSRQVDLNHRDESTTKTANQVCQHR